MSQQFYFQKFILQILNQGLKVKIFIHILIAALFTIDSSGSNPSGKQMDKQNVICKYNRLPVSLKEEGSSHTCYKMNELGEKCQMK